MQYYWFSNQLQGSPVVQNNLLVNFAGFSGYFTVYVREKSGSCNPPCFGPASPVFTVYVHPLPNVNVSPPVIACVGDTITYSVPFVPNTYYSWWLSPGLGTIVDTSNNTIQVVFSSTGIDSVWVQGLNFCGLRQGFRRVKVRDYPVVAPLIPDTICTGDTSLYIATFGTTYWYRWRYGTQLIGMNDSVFVSPTSTSTYTLEVSDSGSCAVYDTVQVTVEQPPLTANYDSLCFGSSITLDATTASAINYFWNNDTTPSPPQYTVTDTGTYSVKVYVAGEVCYRVYTYSLSYSYTDSIDRADNLCLDESILLAPQTTGSNYTYAWSTGATTDTIRVNNPGTYSITISNPAWLCPKVEIFNIDESPIEACSEYNLPNVFSPDGSGLNDFYHPCDNSTAIEQQVKCPPYRNVRDISLRIFNRWGELVYETTDRDIKWNGKKNNTGSDCPDGVYYYTGVANYMTVVNGKSSKELHGFITLMRKK